MILSYIFYHNVSLFRIHVLAYAYYYLSNITWPKFLYQLFGNAFRIAKDNTFVWTYIFLFLLQDAHGAFKQLPNLVSLGKMKFNFQAILPFQIISIRKYNITLAFQFVCYPLTCTRSSLCVHKCDLSVFET